MVWCANVGHSRPVQPAANNVHYVDAFVTAPLQHPLESRSKEVFGAVEGLEIDETNAFQSNRGVVLPAENRIRAQAGAFAGCQDPSAPLQ
jgi:hypothetical protein